MAIIIDGNKKAPKASYSISKSSAIFVGVVGFLNLCITRDLQVILLVTSPGSRDIIIDLEMELYYYCSRRHWSDYYNHADEKYIRCSFKNNK